MTQAHAAEHGVVVEEERDPPFSPTFVTLVVGTAILIVTVVALEASHAVWVASTQTGLDVPAERFGFDIRARQEQQVQDARIPGSDVRGAQIGDAVNRVVQQYGQKR